MEAGTHQAVALDKDGSVTFSGADARTGLSTKERMSIFALLLFLLFFACIGLERLASAQQPGASAPLVNAPLSGEQVVENLIAMNLKRAHALLSYQGTRLYQIEYHGFPGTRSAEMVVDLKYQSPETKEFRIRSATGPKLIIDKVFKRLLRAEQEAQGAEAQKRTALNRDNYDFTLVGYDRTPSSSMYVLSVKPRTTDRFLYRGRIWVDAKDFAVIRLDAEPAKNPSFWTKNNNIEETYTKVSDFWLPERNHSVSAIRFGGRAVLTIQYQNYEITSADPVCNLPTLKSNR
jgi:hypothetical protein